MEIIKCSAVPVKATYSLHGLTEADLIAISHIKLCYQHHQQPIPGCSESFNLISVISELDLLARRYING